MEIRAELEIAASASDVWRVLTDFSSYGEWNPFLTEISGDLVEEATLRVGISLPEGRDVHFSPRLVRCREDRELCWRSHWLFPGLFDSEHLFRLEALGARGTRFIQGQNFSGVLLRFANSSITKAARGLVYMNQALKRRVEGVSRAPDRA